jgi:TetR/AcrR family transcriptional regulator, regulator of cefoperazone and chloramphenicol sensitivity
VSSTNAASTTDTRARLIEVAARHFAEHGYRGASQREIQREIGMNPATAHYHFGSKEALYRGVIEAFIHDVQEERLRRLAAVEPQLTGRVRLQRLLYDYFYPHVRLAGTPAGYSYARILANVQHDYRNTASKIFDDAATPVRRRYVAALGKLFPDAPRTEIKRLLMMGVALMAVTSTWHSSAGPLTPGAVHRLAEELARYTAAGFEALLGGSIDEATGKGQRRRRRARG